jgi:Glycosyltransferase family 87
MTARVFADGKLVPRLETGIGIGELTGRILFIALLAAAPLLPEINSSIFSFPAVTNWWVCVPFCALFLLALLDVRHLCRIYNLDLLVLGSFIVALGCYDSSRTLPVLLLYPPLIYLAGRMIVLARVGRTAGASKTTAFRPWLPLPWLIVGIVVLGAVHVNWALTDPSTSDVGEASVQGARKVVHGDALYGANQTRSATTVDPHYDTYGPFNYEAYVPFAAVASSTIGAVLAFAWLTYPITLYSDGFDFNDALVAATLTGALLAIDSPARRGVMVALAGWTKLSPLALVPVMLAQRSHIGENRPRAVMAFGASFILTSAVIFVPALDHSSLSTFIARSFGYQASRAPEFTIWSMYGDSYRHAAWIVDLSKVVHGLLIALTVGFALALLRLPRRQDLIGLAAASAAVLIALQVCDGYYSFSYLLWFVPLVLVAITLDHAGIPRQRAKYSAGGNTQASDPSLHVRRQPTPLVSGEAYPRSV